MNDILVIEVIVGWLGVGHRAWHGIMQDDMPVIMGATLPVAIPVLPANLAVEIAKGYWDPCVSGEGARFTVGQRGEARLGPRWAEGRSIWVGHEVR